MFQRAYKPCTFYFQIETLPKPGGHSESGKLCLIVLIVRRARSVSVFVRSLFATLRKCTSTQNTTLKNDFLVSPAAYQCQYQACWYDSQVRSQPQYFPKQYCAHITRLSSAAMDRGSISSCPIDSWKITMQWTAYAAWSCWKRHVKQAMPQLPPLWTWHPKPKPIQRRHVSNLVWARVDTFSCALTKAVQKTSYGSMTSLAFPAVAKTVLRML